MMKLWSIKRNSKRDKLKHEILDELHRVIELNRQDFERDLEELKAVSRFYPTKKIYDYTDQKAIDQALAEGYELVYIHPRCKYRVYIKRDR